MEVAVKQYTEAYKVDMGGIFLDQAIPTSTGQRLDPFILLHHMKSHMPEHSNARDHGVGPHPHRGFSPVTFIIQGEVYHQDSRGNRSTIKAGGVQWTNTARGIVHSERPSVEMANRGGYFEVIQLWINIPGKNKMDQPSYYGFQKEELGRWSESDVQISVVSGEVKGTEGPCRTHTPMDIARVDMSINSKLELDQKKMYQSLIYVIEGGLKIKEKTYFTKQLLQLEEGEGALEIQATSNTSFLFLSGIPINEKIVQYGPYVMNSETEIMEAMRDYQLGKMGILIEDFPQISREH